MANDVSAPLRIASATHPAYMPQYLAQALGLFTEADLDVVFLPQPQGHSSIVEHLRDGRTDLVLGSMLFALRLLDDGDAIGLVAQSNQQVRHALIQRAGETPLADFGALRGRSVLAFPNLVPTPWAAFCGALAQQGMSLADLQVINGFSPAEALSEFRRGVGDLLLVDPESIDMTGLVENVRLADVLGPLPWSVYCTTASGLVRRTVELQRFRHALSAAIDWLYTHSGEDAVPLVGHVFPDTAPSMLSATIERYRAARLWRETARVSLDQMRKWDRILCENGLLRKAGRLVSIPILGETE